jgi:hypothetical protein
MPKRKKPAFRDGDEMIVPSAASLGTGKFLTEEFGERALPGPVDKTPENSDLVAKRTEQQSRARSDEPAHLRPVRRRMAGPIPVILPPSERGRVEQRAALRLGRKNRHVPFSCII